MKTLLRSTAVYRSIKEGGMAQSTLLIFEDAVYLRALLKECAKAFFGAEEGSRVARLIDSESYLDCKILPPEGSKLTAETVSGLPAESMLRPAEGKNKLYVIASFESVTPLVQNKLLKLLEEPPAGVYFLLGASSAHGVLPTVLSRMSKYAVERFSAQEIAAALERNYAGSATPRLQAAAFIRPRKRCLRKGAISPLPKRFYRADARRRSAARSAIKNERRFSARCG